MLVWLAVSSIPALAVAQQRSLFDVAGPVAPKIAKLPEAEAQQRHYHSVGECKKTSYAADCLEKGLFDWDCRQIRNPNPNETPEQCVAKKLSEYRQEVDAYYATKKRHSELEDTYGERYYAERIRCKEKAQPGETQETCIERRIAAPVPAEDQAKDDAEKAVFAERLMYGKEICDQRHTPGSDEANLCMIQEAANAPADRLAKAAEDAKTKPAGDPATPEEPEKSANPAQPTEGEGIDDPEADDATNPEEDPGVGTPSNEDSAASPQPPPPPPPPPPPASEETDPSLIEDADTEEDPSSGPMQSESEAGEGADERLDDDAGEDSTDDSEEAFDDVAASAESETDDSSFDEADEADEEQYTQSDSDDEDFSEDESDEDAATEDESDEEALMDEDSGTEEFADEESDESEVQDDESGEEEFPEDESEEPFDDESDE
ncbi:hypothetical protein [Ahniella affigens]|uniref:hypothetical protein n=1 Tax=Ahniella affigens TaxID=2021234 RepID=UPI0011B23863|nr:hypothetical protein [Ahniella affigens]